MKPTRRFVLVVLSKSAGAAALAPRLSFAKTQAATTATAPLVDPLRPAFHYLPSRNWMNDPCAPVFFRGQYHLFHQYNPNASIWGDMHWAHAASPDMIHWKRLPVAIAPTPDGPDSAGVFTGSAIFHHDTPAVIYTGVQSVPHAEATLSDGAHNFRETQLLATSADPNLNIWTKHPQPVIPAPPPAMAVTGFRDPTPFEHAGTQYLLVGSGQHQLGGMVLLYRASRKLPNGSPDLTAWEYLHPLTQDPGFTPPPVPKSDTPQLDPVDTGEMWECPDFFPLGGRHVLLFSTRRLTFWQVGDLDPATLRFHPTSSGQLDHGHSFYAPKSQLDAEGNRILWSWLNETRPQAEFAAASWAGMLSLPRILTIQDGRLRMAPLPALRQLRRPSLGGPVQEYILAPDPDNFPNGPQLRAPTPRDAAGPIFDLRFARQTPASSTNPNQIVITPPNSPSVTVPFAPHDGPVVHAFIDNSVVELFLGNSHCFTHRFYTRTPGVPILSLTLPPDLSTCKPATFSVKSIWPA